MLEEDRKLIRLCLREALDPRYFPDWEFEILMGFSRVQLQSFVDSDPRLEDLHHEDDSVLFVGAVLNNLIRYPHGRKVDLEQALGHTLTDLKDLEDRVFAEDDKQSAYDPPLT